MSTRAPRNGTPSAWSRRRWRSPLASEPSARTIRCHGTVGSWQAGHDHARESRRARGQVAVGGDEALGHGTGASQDLARPGGLPQRVSSTHTSAIANPIWPKASAVPKFAAPSAAAIALAAANAPSMTARSRRVLCTVGSPNEALVWLGTTIRRWTMRWLAYRRMLTDYHVHLRPGRPDAERRTTTSPLRTSTATWRRPRRRGSRSSGSPSTSTGSRRRSTSGTTRSGSRTPATTWTHTATSFGRHRCGSASRWTTSPAARIGSPTCSTRRDFDYVIGSVHFVGDRAVDDDGLGHLGGRRRPGRRLARLLRDARGGRAQRPVRHPRPPGPGQGLGRAPAAARARPALLLRAGGRGDRRGRSRGRGLDRGAAKAGRASSIRRPASRRCASTRVRPSPLLGRPRARATSAHGVRAGARDDERLGRRGDRRLRRARAPARIARPQRVAAKGARGMSVRVGIGYDVHPFAAGRRLVLGGVEIAHERGLERPLRRRRAHPRGDRRDPRRGRAGRPRDAASRPRRSSGATRDSLDLLTVGARQARAGGS